MAEHLGLLAEDGGAHLASLDINLDSPYSFSHPALCYVSALSHVSFYESYFLDGMGSITMRPHRLPTASVPGASIFCVPLEHHWEANRQRNLWFSAFSGGRPL